MDMKQEDKDDDDVHVSVRSVVFVSRNVFGHRKPASGHQLDSAGTLKLRQKKRKT